MQSNRLLMVGLGMLSAVLLAGLIFWATRSSDGDEQPSFQGYAVEHGDPAAASSPDLGVAVPTAPMRRAGASDEPPDRLGRRPPRGAERTDRSPREALRGAEDTLNDPGPDPSEVPKPPPREGTGDAPAGTLDKDDVRKGIEAVRPLVKACYEEALQEFPEASGRVTVGFRIIGEEGEGRVEMSELDREKTDLFDERLHDCMLKSVGEATFAVPEGGGVVNVTYPFQFSSGSDEEVEE